MHACFMYVCVCIYMLYILYSVLCMYSCGGGDDELSDETVRERGARRRGSVDVASVSDCCGNAFH